MYDRGVTSVKIRAERPEDHGAVHKIHTAAFPTSAEADLVDRLRPVAHPCISLVAEADHKIVGHILFTPVTVSDSQTDALVMGLAPMAVVPARQSQGVGSELVRSGLDRCRELGVSAVVVLGHAEYYPRFEFVPAAQAGMHYQSDEYNPYFFVLELADGALARLQGSVEYHPEFDNI